MDFGGLSRIVTLDLRPPRCTSFTRGAGRWRARRPVRPPGHGLSISGSRSDAAAASPARPSTSTRSRRIRASGSCSCRAKAAVRPGATSTRYCQRLFAQPRRGSAPRRSRPAARRRACTLAKCAGEQHRVVPLAAERASGCCRRGPRSPVRASPSIASTPAVSRSCRSACDTNSGRLDAMRDARQRVERAFGDLTRARSTERARSAPARRARTASRRAPTSPSCWIAGSRSFSAMMTASPTRLARSADRRRGARTRGR